MPYGSLDRTPPPFFKQGPTSLSKLLLLSALALFLMVADKRFEFGKIVRASLATALNPVVNTVLKPVATVQDSFKYLDTINSVKLSEQEAHKKLLLLSQRANQVETLALENSRLRQLLSLKETLSTPAQAAEVLYDATDPYSRKIIVNKGSVNAVQLGSPVIDELGVLGQVVRVFPLTSEVAMIIDREQTTPVLNTRTGVRSVAYGNPSANGDVLELRFISGNADVLAGDVLTTSGVDGVYPAGLLVAKIEKVERRADSGFAKIICTPKANVLGAKHVMILNPLSTIDTPRPTENIPAVPSKRGAKK
ncbi:MAG: rod shape-determining protein MreC [Burkholderiaceae bacterium]